MHVLCITVRADYGGGPTHLFALITGGANTNFMFSIACPKEEPYWKRFAQVVEDRMFEIPHRKLDLFLLPKLISFIKEKKIDLLHSHGKGAGVYARILSLFTGKPCIHTPHGIHVGELSMLRKFVYLLYERISSRWVDHVIYVSNSEKEYANKLGLYSDVASSVIYNGIDTPNLNLVRSNRVVARKELFAGNNPFVVGTLSRFNFQKNMNEAWLIAKACPELTFLWIGDGPDMVSLKNLTVSQGIKNIFFTGFTDRPDFFLSACDAYLSSSRWEGLPLGVLEAMSIGLPVIASNVVGNDEAVIDGETGFLYQLGDIDQAVSCLRKIADNSDVHENISGRSISRMRTVFDKKVMVNETTKLYAELVE